MLALQAAFVHRLRWVKVMCELGAVASVHNQAAIVLNIAAMLLQVLLVPCFCFKASC
jgi:hypothetical protein